MSVNYRLSYISDGSMSKAVPANERDANRAVFLHQFGLTPEQTILVHLTYETNDFCRYRIVGKDEAGDGIVRLPSFECDALFTRDKSTALLLPIADCIAAVLYDPKHEVFGLGHLGRHNLEQSGGTHMISFMQQSFGSDPADLTIWLSPAAGAARYPLYSFDNRSLHQVALEQLVAGGVVIDRITTDRRDTTAEATLFSHSQFLKGEQAIDGRQSVVAWLG